MAVAEPEMKLALVLALHTGQRQGDLLRLAWSNYNGTHLSLRQGKSRRGDKPDASSQSDARRRSRRRSTVSKSDQR